MSNKINKVELPIAVNWHLEPRCNYKCNFCFAHFTDVKKEINYDVPELFTSLFERGARKITFVGGEPMLDRRIDALIPLAKDHGFTTCIVTNGTKVTEEWLKKMTGKLDWIGFSIDASTDELHAKMGRGLAGEIKNGTSNHLTRCLKSWTAAKNLGYRLKLNTVVTSHNKKDDMSSIVSELCPDRWKVFQVLKVIGENENSYDTESVTKKEFNSWVNRHNHLNPVVETNELMRGSYCMIDGELRFKSDATGEVEYSDSIKDVGIDVAWNQIDAKNGFSKTTFDSRGGVWKW